MNFLIVVPRIINKADDFYQFPQGIAYISAVMTKAGFNLIKLNLNNITESPETTLLHVIKKNKIDVLLTGGLTGQYGAIFSILEAVKMLNSKIVTIVGGGIITSAPELAMEALEYSDYGVIGEGENIVCELCQALESNADVKSIAGVVYKDGSQYVVTEGRPEPVDVNNIPFPDYDGLGLKKLLETVPNIVGMNEFNTIPIITSRGCPFKCTFCFHPSGQKYRCRLLDDVFKEIDWLISEYNVKFLAIQDELFSQKKSRVVEFCKRIKPYGIKWTAQLRVTDITEELVLLLKKSNCVTIGFGVESADNSILESMNKRIKIEDTDRALKLVYDAGIGIQGCLIFGDRAETRETAQKTIQWWKENIHYGLQLSTVVTYPGTELFRYALSNQIITDPVKFIKDSCPTIKLSNMSTDDYSWMLEQLLLLQRSEQNIPQKVVSTDIDFDNSCMNLSAFCNSCDELNRWSKVRFFIAESLTCSKCGKRHYSPIPDELVSHVEKNVDALFKKYKKVCFWGINSYFYTLLKMLSYSQLGNIVCVDKSKIRHGIKILDGKVNPTEVIVDEKIECIIVTVPQYYTSLKPTIEAEFPHVKEIINILEMIK